MKTTKLIDFLCPGGSLARMVALALLLCAALATRAAVTPQTTDDTNPDTYQGWVDNTDGHLTAGQITSSNWKGGDVPKERFIYINQANFPDAEFRRYFSGNLRDQNKAAFDAAFDAGTYKNRGKAKTGNPFWVSSDNYATHTGYITEQELGFITTIDLVQAGKPAHDGTGVEYFTNLEILRSRASTTTNNPFNLQDAQLCALSKLKELSVGWLSTLTTIDLANHPLLEKLAFGSFGFGATLTNVQLRGSQTLKELEMSGTSFDVDLDGLYNLEKLILHSIRRPQALDLSSLKKVANLELSYIDDIEELNIAGLDELENVSVFRCRFNKVSVGDCGKLKTFYIDGGGSLPALTIVDCEELHECFIQRVPTVQTLTIRNTGLNSIDLTMAYGDANYPSNSYQVIDLSNNKLSKIVYTKWRSDVGGGTPVYEMLSKLTELNISRNRFTLADMQLLLLRYLSDNGGTLYAYDNTAGDERNEMPTLQLWGLAQSKGWAIKVKEGDEWVDLTFDDIEINEANFPDANFRAWLLDSDNLDGYGADGRLTATELAAITTIDCSGQGITDLTGIRHFVALRSLDCSDNELTALDLHALAGLVTLNAQRNRLETFDLTDCTSLRTINLMQNQIAREAMYALVDQAGTIGLFQSDRADIMYSTLPVVSLYVYNDTDPDYPEGNELGTSVVTTLNARQWKVYKWEDTLFGGNVDDMVYINSETMPNQLLRRYISEVAYDDNKAFVAQSQAAHTFTPRKSGANPFYYGTSANDYSYSLTPQEVRLIRELRLYKWNKENRGDTQRLITDLTGIQLLDSLVHLDVSGHKLEELDMSNMKNLRILRCHEQVLDNPASSPGIDGRLTRLNVKGCPVLHQIYCDHNDLKTIDVTECPELREFRLNNNRNLESLDVTQNPELIWLDCYNCLLPSLDVSHNPALERLFCYEERDNEVDGVSSTRRGLITGIDFSNNPELFELRISNNPLEDLDLTHNPKLRILFCNSIDMSGGMLQKNLSSLPALTQLSCYNDTLATLDVSKNLQLDTLICYRNNLKRLDVSKNTSMTYLSCGENGWHPAGTEYATAADEAGTSIDHNRAPLPYGGNQITTLDVSNNVNLVSLHCAQNLLTELDLTGLTNLEDLNYDEQYRRIQAEYSLYAILDPDTGLPTQLKNLYYFRMEEPTSGDQGGQGMQTRIAVTDWDGISRFDIGRVDMGSWLQQGSSTSVFDGSRAPRRAAMNDVATAGDLAADGVVGSILVLQNVTQTMEAGGVAAEGTGVKYKYDVKLDGGIDPSVDKHTYFTLDWYTEPGVITAVDELPVGREVAGVTYHNLAGQSSDRPFEGVNIVVTRYSDGTTATSKLVK